MFNIKTERFEKQLMAAEQKRIAKQEAMEALGDDAAKEASSSSESEEEQAHDRTIRARMC